MNLLSEEEIGAMTLPYSYAYINDVSACKEFVRTIEAAILAKLASAELPEPDESKLLVIGLNNSYDTRTMSFTEAGFGAAAKKIYKIGQSQAHAQGFAAGAASQLAEKPSAWKWTANKFHDRLEAYCPPDDAYDEGTLIELYTRREA